MAAVASDDERSPTLLSVELRTRLRLDPTLGAGNFIHAAHELSAAPALPVVYAAHRDPLSISALLGLARRYGASYFQRGIRRMDTVGVCLADGVDILIQYLALTSLGAIPALISAELTPEQVSTFVEQTRLTALVVDESVSSRVAALCQQVVGLVIELKELADSSGELPAIWPFRHDHDDPVMITHTSGTTGAPKPVVLQHGRWFHGVRHLLGLQPPQGAHRYLSVIPPFHNAAIAFAMHAILSGSEIMIASDRSGAGVVSAIETFRPATVVAFPQTFVELADLDLGEHDLSSVTMWINSGDAAHEPHIRRLVAHGYHHRGAERVSGSQFVDGLGSSEMGQSSFRIIHTASTSNYDRCVGLPQAWVDAAVLNEDGQPLATGEIGRLGIRSPSVTCGYWNDSQTTFRSRLSGYWLTGDVVYRDHSGCFYHLDRVADVIQTSSGPLYSLQTEELVLKLSPELSDCTVVGVGADDRIHRAVALLVPRRGVRVDAAAVLDRVNRVLRAGARAGLDEVRCVDRHSIPIGVSGKVLKRELRRTLQPSEARHE